MEEKIIKLISTFVIMLFLMANFTSILARENNEEPKQDTTRINNESFTPAKSKIEKPDQQPIQQDQTRQKQQDIQNEKTTEEKKSSDFEVTYIVEFDETDFVFKHEKGYDFVSLEDGGIITTLGDPMLPVEILRVALPSSMKATDVRVVNVHEVPLKGEYLIFPAQQPMTLSSAQQNLEFQEPNSAVYDSNDPYPSQILVLREQKDLFGQNMVVLEVRPLQYIPSEKSLTLFSSVEFTIEGVEGYSCTDTLLGTLSSARVQSCKQQVMDMVINPDDVSLPDEGASEGTPCSIDPEGVEYLIITISDWVDDFQPLATWKTQKGIPAEIVTTSFIYEEYVGDDNPAKIRACIADYHNNHGTQYVLLGGDCDENLVPTDYKFFFGLTDIDQGFARPVASDTYYSDFNGDWHCEVSVGRAPVNTIGQIQTFVNKVLQYEQNPPLSEYAEKIGMFAFELIDACSHYVFGYPWTPGYWVTEDIIEEYLPDDMDITKVYDDVGDSSTRNFKQEVKNAVNGGLNLINHIDHCNWNKMGTAYSENMVFDGIWCEGDTAGYLNPWEVSLFDNEDKQSIMYSIGCWPAAFDDYTPDGGHEPDRDESIAEYFVNDQNGGGVAFIGNTRYGLFYLGCDDYASMRYDRYFFKSLFEDSDQNHFKLGDCFIDHKNDAFGSWGGAVPDSPLTPVIDQYIFTELVLLGDPELPIWTENPTNWLDIDHDDVVCNYEEEVRIVDSCGSPVADALVCLSDEQGNFIARNYTNSNGTTVLNIESEYTGESNLTATAHNYQYAMRPVYVSHWEHNVRLGYMKAPSVIPFDSEDPVEIPVEISVYNTGNHTVSNLYVNFSVNGVPKDQIIIDSLDSRQKEHVTFHWNATPRGPFTFNITLSSILDEEYLGDNYREVETYVTTFPIVVYSPDPSIGERQIPIDEPITFGFTGGDPEDDGDQVYFDLYFGLYSHGLAYIGQFGPYDGGSEHIVSVQPTGLSLDWDTTYYWKVVSRDNHGASTSGPIWHFDAKCRPTDIWVNASWTETDHGSGEWGYEAFNNISAALDMAAEGATIHLAPGTYYGPDHDGGTQPWPWDHTCILIEKSVSIIGSGTNETIIDGTFGQAVVIYGAQDVSLSECTITSGYLGIVIENSEDVLLANLAIETDDGSGVFFKYDSYDCDISQCLFTNNYYGIEIMGFSMGKHTFTDNIFMENMYGIWIDIGCGENHIYGNNFINNTDFHHVVDNNGNSNWDNGVDSGNFWEGFSGTDVDEDDIWDQPYEIKDVDEHPTGWDHYPRVHPTSLYVDAKGPYEGIKGKDILFDCTIFGMYPPFDCFWDFGDGNASQIENPIHSYSEPGEYVVTLTVNDSQDNIKQDVTIATVKMIDVDIIGSYENEEEDVAVHFEASVDFADELESLRYRWDFGDETYTWYDNPTDPYNVSIDHEYTEDGVYTASLTVRKLPLGSGINDSDDVDVVVFERFHLDANGPYYGIVDREVQFEASVQESPSAYNWTWDFGDETDNVSGPDLYSVQHTYTENGTYTVTVTADDGDDEATVQTTANISEAPSLVYVDDNFDESTPFWGYNVTDNIPDAIDMVVEGGTVYVYPGVYFGRDDQGDLGGCPDDYALYINKSVALIGDNRETTYINGVEPQLDNNNAIFIYCTHNVTICNFTITTSSQGVIVKSSDNVVIDNNTIFSGYEGGYQFDETTGVYFDQEDEQYSSDCKITGNTFMTIGFSIYTQYVWNLTIYDNMFVKHGCGILIDLLSEWCTIYQNSFFEHLHDYGYGHAWQFNEDYWGEHYIRWNSTSPGGNSSGIGNYWDDYNDSYPNPVDEDEDGIWDNGSYPIDVGGEDHYPSVHPFHEYNKPPVAYCGGNWYVAYANETITFTAEYSYDPESSPLTYEWDFGDGTHSYQPVVEKSYAEAEEDPYTVVLRVYDNKGQCGTASALAVIYPEPESAGPVIYPEPSPAGPFGGSGYWTGTEIVTIERDNQDYFADMEIGPDGTIHVVWEENWNVAWSLQIFYKYRDPDGTWSLPERLAGGAGIAGSAASFASYPNIAIDPDGNIHCIWYQNKQTMYQMKDNSTTRWTSAAPPYPIGPLIETHTSANFSMNRPTAIDIDEYGNVYVAWIGIVDTWIDPIMFRTKTKGLGWGETRIESASEEFEYYESVCLGVDDNGVVHLAFAAKANSVDYMKVYYKYRTMEGNWSAHENVSNNMYGRNPSMFVEGDGTVHVCWDNQYATGVKNIYYRCRPAEDGNFSDGIEIVSIEGEDPEEEYRRDPSVGVDSIGTVHVVWQDSRDLDMDGYNPSFSVLYRCKPRDYSWDDAYDIEIVSNESIIREGGINTSQSWRPVLRVDDTKTVHVVWEDGMNLDDDSGDVDIFYKKRLGDFPPPWREPGAAIGPYTAGEPGVPDGGACVGDVNLHELEGVLAGPGSSGLLGSDVVGCDGLSVDIATGEVSLAYAVDDHFVLRYSSLMNETSSSVLGYGWRHSGDLTLNDTVNCSVVITDPYGWRSVYSKVGDDFIRPIGRLANLSVVNGSYELHYFDGSKVVFTDEPLVDGLYHIKYFVNRFDECKAFGYNNGGLLVQIRSSYGRKIELEYNNGKKLIGVTDSTGELTGFSYDDDLLVAIEDPLSNNVSFGYGNSSRFTNLTLKNGVSYSVVYGDDVGGSFRDLRDSLNNRVVKVSASSFPQKLNEFCRGGFSVVTDGVGNNWTHYVNMFGRRTRVVPHACPEAAHQAVFGDGGAGWLIEETNALGYTSEYSYDEFGNVVNFINELGHLTEYVYGDDTPALRTEVVKGLSSFSVEYYDDNRLHKVFDLVGNPVTFSYRIIAYYDPYSMGESGNNVRKITRYDRLGDQVIFEYDELGSLEKKTVVNSDGFSPVTLFSYDLETGFLANTYVHRDTYDYTETWYDRDVLGRLLNETVDPINIRNPDGLNLTTRWSYDPSGLLVTETNPRGVTAKCVYDHRNRLNQTIEDFNGKNVTTNYVFDAAGRINRTVDPLEYETVYEYDELSRLKYVTDPVGICTEYGYDVVGNVIMVKMTEWSDERMVNFSYDPLGRLSTTTVDPEGLSLTSTVEYWDSQIDGAGNFSDLVYKVVDPKGKVAYSYYYPNELPWKVVGKVNDTVDNGGDSDDAVSRFFYDLEGQVNRSVGPEGETSVYVYDSVGRLKNVYQDPDGFNLTTSYEYDGLGSLVSETLPNGNVLSYCYDSVGRMLNVSDLMYPNDPIESYLYDENGNVLSRTDAKCRMWEYMYDSLDRLEFMFDLEYPDSPDWFVYDDRGGLVYHIDKNNVSTEYFYDGNGRVVEQIDDKNGEVRNTTYTYTLTGNVETVGDHGGNDTTYVYDNADRLCQIFYPFVVSPPVGPNITMNYDEAGNVVSRVDRSGLETVMEYDDLHRLVKVIHPEIDTPDFGYSGFDDNYTYDRSGRLTNASNPWACWNFSYDALGRMDWQKQTVFLEEYAEIITCGSYLTDFDYDVGSVTTINVTYPGGREVSQFYDLRMRLFNVTSDDNVSGIWDYDVAGDFDYTEFGNGVFCDFEYDDVGRITNMNYTKGESLLYGDRYWYNKVSNVRAVQKWHDLYNSELYSYDTYDRLVGIERGLLDVQDFEIDEYTTSPYLAQTQDWLLDKNGNWIETTMDYYDNSLDYNESREVNESNEYTSIYDEDEEEDVLIKYDINGNLMIYRNLNLFYDSEDRLVEVNDDTYDLYTLYRFRYGPLGHRVITEDCYTIPTEINIFLHLYADGAEIQELMAHTFLGDCEEGVHREYIYGASGLLAMVDHVGSEVFYYLLDRQGSVVALTNNSGDIVERCHYEPYGDVWISDDAGVLIGDGKKSSVGNPFMWKSMRYDDLSDLFFSSGRHYSPELGRWLTGDPAGYSYGLNSYEYGRSNPVVTKTDPSLTYPRAIWNFVADSVVETLRAPKDLLAHGLTWIFDSDEAQKDFDRFIMPFVEDFYNFAEAGDTHPVFHTILINSPVNNVGAVIEGWDRYGNKLSGPERLYRGLCAARDIVLTAAAGYGIYCGARSFGATLCHRIKYNPCIIKGELYAYGKSLEHAFSHGITRRQLRKAFRYAFEDPNRYKRTGQRTYRLFGKDIILNLEKKGRIRYNLRTAYKKNPNPFITSALAAKWIITHEKKWPITVSPNYIIHQATEVYSYTWKMLSRGGKGVPVATTVYRGPIFTYTVTSRIKFSFTRIFQKGIPPKTYDFPSGVYSKVWGDVRADKSWSYMPGS